MGSTSNARTRTRIRVELWSWAAWLVLCIISYPALVIVYTAPRAGLVGCICVGGFLILVAGLGYAQRRELESWQVAALTATGVGAAVWLAAYSADGAALATAALCAATTAATIIFIWHFLPWIVQDADATELAFRPRSQRWKRPSQVRGALGLALLLSFVTLGLGAAWARGERGVPHPTGWLLLVMLLALGLMFVERLSFFERSAREGNLVLPRGSQARWLAAALVVLVFGVLVAAVTPWKPFPEQTHSARVGSAPVETGPAGGASAGRATESSPSAAALLRSLAGSISTKPRSLFLLWLLLLGLILAVLLAWLLRRTRPRAWLARLARRISSAAARAFRWLSTALAKLLPGRRKAPAESLASAAVEPIDPLSDLFGDASLLAKLSPREVAIHTYHLLLSFAEMLGHRRPPGYTPFEYLGLLDQAAPEAEQSARVLTWGYVGAMYGGDEAEVPDLSTLREAWHRIAEALRGNLTAEDLALRRRAYLASKRSPSAIGPISR